MLGNLPEGVLFISDSVTVLDLTPFCPVDIY